MTKDLRERLKEMRIDPRPAVAERHLAAIRAELAVPAAAPTPHRTPHRTSSPRRLVLAVVTAAVLLIPAAAFAAQDSIPGDLLYPVKRSTEWVWSRVDSEMPARHRVQELERVLERRAPREVIDELLTDAEATVTEGSPELTRRLERAREQVRSTYGSDTPGGSQGRSDGSSLPDTAPGNGGASGSGISPPDGTDDAPGATTGGGQGPASGVDDDGEGRAAETSTTTSATTSASIADSAPDEPPRQQDRAGSGSGG